MFMRDIFECQICNNSMFIELKHIHKAHLSVKSITNIVQTL